MNIGIDKKGFFWDEADKVIAHLKELRQDQSAFNKEEQKRMMDFYTDGTLFGKVIDFNATIAKNLRPIMDDSEGFDPTIDVWCEMFVEGFVACFRVCFFLQDFWSLSDENREEVKQRAYIRKFTAE